MILENGGYMVFYYQNDEYDDIVYSDEYTACGGNSDPIT